MSKTSEQKYCFCGRPLHYTVEATRLLVEEMIEAKGPDLVVTAGGRSFLVPRHYLALHGLKASEVAALGFPEITSQGSPR